MVAWYGPPGCGIDVVIAVSADRPSETKKHSGEGHKPVSGFRWARAATTTFLTARTSRKVAQTLVCHMIQIFDSMASCLAQPMAVQNRVVAQADESSLKQKDQPEDQSHLLRGSSQLPSAANSVQMSRLAIDRSCVVCSHPSRQIVFHGCRLPPSWLHEQLEPLPSQRSASKASPRP